ncbi:PH domain-containing protein [Luteimonas sp. SDU82]|uniref:PH domain-containing protein n=1 Tax=Luteimonas sp. SDU82 TaxID=3422592 RepID=UPI003EBEE877
MSAPDTAPDLPGPADDDAGWQPLPSRARWLFVLGSAFGNGLLALVLLVPIGLLVAEAWRLPLALAVLVALPAFGAWAGQRRYAWTRWRLDGDGYALRRGRLWRQETLVPGSRVQHLDLRHGPIERRFGLSTLVIHTAGTRSNAVATAGLDAADAERLRDRLARWIETDDDEP